MGANSVVKSEKPASFQNFEDAIKKILTVSKEDVERREKEAKEAKQKSGKKRHSI